MLNKIYLVALAVFALVMIVLTYLTYSQLQSVGFAPSVIADSYLTYENYFRQFLWMSSLLLLILANVLLWTQQKSWSLWAALLYFAIFILLQGWWLNSAFLDYQQKNNLTQNRFSLGILISTIICIVATVGIFFNQFLVLRMRDRMYKMDSTDGSTGIELIKENSSTEES